MNSVIEAFDARLDAVPTSPGVYLMKDSSGLVIYVGKAKNLKNRLRSYFGKNPVGNEKVLAMISHVADFEFVVVKNELESLILESNMIKRYQPHYNILLRDDKGYPYVCVTMNEDYPRIFRVFRVGNDKGKGARYFGPFLAGDLYRAMTTLKDIFPTKTCRRVFPRDIGKERPCLNYHIGKCVAPCKGDVPKEAYRAVMENICAFFEGRYDGIQKNIREQMMEASAKEEYEKAAVFRDRLLSLERIMESQKVSFPRESDADVLGIGRDAGEICIRKLEIRAGRITGSLTFFFPDNKEPDEEIVAAFIEQHYPDAAVVPAEILMPALPSDPETLSSYLQGLSGKKTIFHVPQRGDKAHLLKMASQNAEEALTRRILRIGDSEKAITQALSLLADNIGMDKLPERIEAYDISNLGADDRCGGMVVFQHGRPDRTGYRLFKINGSQGQDDYAAMREVLHRRFAHAEEDFARTPDLVLMDGGAAHVTLAEETLRDLGFIDRVAVAGMVKDNRHRTRGLTLVSGTTLELSETASSDEQSMLMLRLLTAIQNEVHRYAITYQKKLSKKRNLSFKLEAIEGIGPAKRRALLAHFGTIGKVAAASAPEIAEVSLLSKANAEAVYQHFHEKNEQEKS